jgi:hypothetical protein
MAYQLARLRRAGPAPPWFLERVSALLSGDEILSPAKVVEACRQVQIEPPRPTGGRPRRAAAAALAAPAPRPLIS